MKNYSVLTGLIGLNKRYYDKKQALSYVLDLLDQEYPICLIRLIEYSKYSDVIPDKKYNQDELIELLKLYCPDFNESIIMRNLL